MADNIYSLFIVVILSWIHVHCIAAECTQPSLLDDKDYMKLDIKSSPQSAELGIFELLFNSEPYTGPKGKNINITLAVPHRKALDIQEICVKTTCVKKFEVIYYGPWTESSFLDASGEPMWIEESPVQFPEEKYTVEGGCQAEDTCFDQPGKLIQVSLTFVLSKCAKCSAVTIDSVNIKACLDTVDPKRVPQPPPVISTVDFSKFRMMSTAGDGNSVLSKVQGSGSGFVDKPQKKKFNITFEVPGMSSVVISSMCMETKCVSKILVEYYGPWQKETFQNAVGATVWKYKATWYPEEKPVKSQCSFTETCFTLPAEPSRFKPSELSKFSLIFTKSTKCSDCNEIMVRKLQAQI